MKNKKTMKAVEEDDPRQYLFRSILSLSQYDFSELGFGYRRNPDMDTDNSIGFDVFVSKAKTSENTTCAVTEIFTISVYADSFVRTAKEFDERVSRLSYITPPKKDEKMGKTAKCAKKCEHKCTGECKTSKKITLKPSIKPKARKEFVKTVTSAALDALKKFLLKNTKFNIPFTKFRVFFDRIDKKSQKNVFELRFYPKNYKSGPKSASTYEKVPFRVKLRDDNEKLMVARFDKVVKELKTVAFKTKK